MLGVPRSPARWLAALVLLGTALPLEAVAAGVDRNMYFSHNGSRIKSVSSVPLSGGFVRPLYPDGGGHVPFGLDIDFQAGLLYWADIGTDSIRRAPLDGSDFAEDLITTGLFDPQDIALDVAGGKMYFTDTRNSRVKRANLDGSGVESLFPVTRPEYIELDVFNQTIYYSHLGGDLSRANFDGSGRELLIRQGAGHGFDLDLRAGKIYYADWDTNGIKRANLDGSGVEDVLTGLFLDPLDVALDPTTSLLYWSTVTRIYYYDLEAGGPIGTLTTVPAGGLNDGIHGLALPEPAGRLLLVLALLLLAARRAGSGGTGARRSRRP